MTGACAVVGAGPAALMAAEVLADAGHSVTVFEAKPSPARKFLMAGKSGLNLTKSEDPAPFLAAFTEAAPQLAPMLAAFGPQAVRDWAHGLDQATFVGTSARVFPRAMKASPLLRAWLARLAGKGVTLRTRALWRGWEGDDLIFDTVAGPERFHADATVLALGGASWARLGSDGAWAAILRDAGVEVTNFAPANVALTVAWSDHMARHFGQPVKGTGLGAGGYTGRGEFVITPGGLEGGGIYVVSRGVREGHTLTLDLKPDLDVQAVTARIADLPAKRTLAEGLRRALRLTPVHLALLQEFGRPLPRGGKLANLIKALPVSGARLGPMNGAISTAGGVAWEALDDGLMLRAKPGVYCAGEMLNWEAPTGGYLINGALATGRWAGQAADRRISAGMDKG